MPAVNLRKHGLVTGPNIGNSGTLDELPQDEIGQLSPRLLSEAIIGARRLRLRLQSERQVHGYRQGGQEDKKIRYGCEVNIATFQ